MIEELLEELNIYRANPYLWKELKWKASKDSVGEYFDENKSKRDKLIIALQFAFTQQDEKFLQFLFQQEILDRLHDPFQGVTTILRRCGFLLASFNKPEHVWLFVEAKTANFDTHCGFDWEYMLSAGVEATFKYVESHEHPMKAGFSSYFPSRKECALSEEDIIQWKLQLEATFPKEIARTDVESWMFIGLELGQKAQVGQLLQTWLQNQEWKEDSLRTLKYFQSYLGDVAGEISTTQKLIGFIENDDQRAYIYSELASLYLKNNQREQAWSSIKEAVNRIKSIDKGILGGLGECALDIICQSSSKERWLQEPYAFGLLHQPYYMSLQYLSKVVQASQRMNDEKAEERYTALLEAEKKRIAVELEKLK